MNSSLTALEDGQKAAVLRDSILSNSVAAEFPSIDVRVSASKGQKSQSVCAVPRS
uniref:Uncharacterized protein n=1 Tax=Fusarium oxysporum (strain Fo5176) TaxID=660025 RepID=A0A0D2XHJ8_FUSOF